MLSSNKIMLKIIMQKIITIRTYKSRALSKIIKEQA
jgi:hypothetical protein